MAEPAAWADAPFTWPLAHGEVHVWLAVPGVLETHAAGLAALLSPDEHERAARHLSRGGRDRFVLERGTLRLLLSSYLGLLPQAVRFQYGPHGKPSLAASAGEVSLRFNISHSHERVLFAFLRHYEIGVDVEMVRELPEAERITRRWFSTREQAALGALPQDERKAAFFRCWTRKEAYVKAVGGGISMSLSSFDVSLAPGEPAVLLAVAGQPDAPTRWALRDLPEITGYASALAVESHDLRLRCWLWTADTLQRILDALPWL